MSNRLSTEPSRYLSQHAENPVEWYPWGDEAFERAELERKPVLVSIGYSSCHWCHVMAHESFEDPETAAKINELFVPIKVDKEEFPDVDGYYMSFLTQLSGSGGWPLNVLTNSHKAPFYGFTYLPSDSLLSTLEYARGEYDRLDRIREQRINTGFSQQPVAVDQISRAIEAVDFTSPSTSSGPQFPQALYLALALESGNDAMVRTELENLITKGLFDHIEGGWFRYSVDPDWKIPHFEKMLYDQASLLLLCAEAHSIEPDLTSYAISRTIGWLSEHMRLENGLYGSATDADTKQGEGIYYTFEEIRSEDEVNLFRLTECGRHEDRYLPWLDFDTYAASPERAEQLMAQRRSERTELVRPGLDGKAVFSWNAFLGYALYRAADALHDATIKTLADGLTRALGKIAEGGISHVVYENNEARGYRYLQDHASYLLLLAAVPDHDADLRGRIESTLDSIGEHFVDDERIWHTDHNPFESQSLWQDTPFPSGGSMLLNALADTGSADSALAPLLCTNIVEVASEHPMFFPFWIRGFSRHVRDAT